MPLDVTTQFAEQVTVNQLVQNVVYASGAMGAPFVAYAVYEFIHKLKIDEHKLIPLFIGAGVVTAFVLAFILKRTTGLKVSEEDQATGLDKVYWGIEPDVEPLAETSSSESGSAT